MPFWNELRRRNVFKVAGAYALLAWLLVQVASAVFPSLLLPGWTVTLVTVLLIIGFPVAILLAWAYELTPEGIKPAAQAGTADHSGSGSRLNYVLAGLLVLGVGFVVLDRTLLSLTGTGGGQAGGTIRLAVLPCDNLSPDPNSPDFAPGIHDELLNRLALIGNLRLTSRTSVLQYSDAAARPTVPEIGASLAVDTIMECSVTHAGNNLRFTTQVIDVAEDAHVWSGSYTADMSDLDALFETQAEIAMDVANAVSVRFFAAEIERIARAPTRSPEAYELYLSALGLRFRAPGPGVRTAARRTGLARVLGRIRMAEAVRAIRRRQFRLRLIDLGDMNRLSASPTSIFGAFRDQRRRPAELPRLSERHVSPGFPGAQ